MEQLTGRVTADAKVEILESGKQIVNFSVAPIAATQMMASEDISPSSADAAYQL